MKRIQGSGQICDQKLHVPDRLQTEVVMGERDNLEMTMIFVFVPRLVHRLGCFSRLTRPALPAKRFVDDEEFTILTES